MQRRRDKRTAAGALRPRKLSIREDKANWKAERDSTLSTFGAGGDDSNTDQTKRPTESIAGVAKEYSAIEADYGGL